MMTFSKHQTEDIIYEEQSLITVDANGVFKFITFKLGTGFEIEKKSTCQCESLLSIS